MLKGLFKDTTARDLAWLTLAKILVILVIYLTLFAFYDGRPLDTAAHLLGPPT